MPIQTNSQYDVINAQNVKEPVVVIVIEDVPFVLASSTVYTQIRYDDPDVFYDGTYVYDGLRPLGPDDPSNPQRLIDRKGTKTSLVQKLEQWDGRSSVETLNMRIVDQNGLITKLLSPGFLVDEILNKKVKVYFGYSQLSFPDQFIRLFTGYINETNCGPGFVSFNFTDPSSKRKQILFNNSKSKLTSDITDTISTTVNVTSTSNFYQSILDAKGNPDTAVTLAFKIDDEIMTYTNANIVSGTQLTGVVRGAFGTVAATHNTDADVTPVLRIHENCITQALKLMLSGWNGPWVSNINLRGIVNTDGGTPPVEVNTITFAQGVDLQRDYGLVEGDYIILSGSPNPGNNGVWTIASFTNSNRTVRTLETGLIQENPVTFLTTVAAFRSKYDTYPIDAGLGLTPDEVFVSRHEYFRNTFLQYVMDFIVVGSEKSGKEFIEKNIMKPLGAYTLTQGAKLSMGVTHPPLSTDVLPLLNPQNIVEPGGIVVKRGLNTRFFYNEVKFNYNYDPVKDQFNNSTTFVDADAQSRMKQVSPLEIDAKGFKLGDELIFNQRSRRLLLRYRYSAETIENVYTHFGVGHVIDSGDTVILDDIIDPQTGKPILQIANTETGVRGVFNRLVEVQERSVDISSGRAKFTLLSNLGFSKTDRYATISGASLIDTVYSNSRVRFKDSFGALYPGAEWKKWQKFDGSTVRVHDTSYTNDAETVFTLDPIDPYIMNFSPALPFTPLPNMVIEFAKYNSTDPSVNALVKQTFVHLDTTVTIASASSSTVFTLTTGFSSRYQSGMTVYVMSPDGSRYSTDVQILTIIADTVTVNKSLGFTPLAGDLMQLAGFRDGPSPGYRYI